MLCDSNILIYAADPLDVNCGSFVERDDACIASLSRIEVLGFPQWDSLPEVRRARLQDIIASMIELALNEQVIGLAIRLRQQRRMSLGDAVIAATALAYAMPLVSRNVDDFKHIAELRLIDPFAGG